MLHTGGCLCGGVRYRIHGALAAIQICHCGQCRKAQGAAFGANIPVDAGAFDLHAGAELLREYQATPGKRRFFCSGCGSPLFSRRDSLPGVLRVRAGTLDGEVASQVELHFHTASKANWWPIDDGLPQHPGAS